MDLWIENVAMDEVERLKRKAEDPDKDRWSRQYVIMQVFDQLIANTDRNQTNILYDKDWKLWMIDHILYNTDFQRNFGVGVN